MPQIRPHFFVKLVENVYIHEFSADERRFAFPIAVDEERLNHIEIRDREDRSLITVIELLSPTNKRTGPDRAQFLGKRKQLLASGVNYVEIDLLRGGPRLPFEDLPDCDYYVMVRRAEERQHGGLWALRLRDPLPRIPIPLRAPFPDANLDLQGLLHHLYDAGGYGDYIYSGKPQPPLHPADAAWAREVIGPSVGS